MLADGQSSQEASSNKSANDGLINSISGSRRHPHIYTKERSIAAPASPTVASLSLRVTTEDTQLKQRMHATVLINGHPVCLQLDTSSDVNIISETQQCFIGLVDHNRPGNESELFNLDMKKLLHLSIGIYGDTRLSSYNPREPIHNSD
ncbi:unnamed protein product [Mesocestoides corti]|uniref:Peptidase A2 domain-containing protein n=1 Tax=Mesocestoides corti TaxID=53468 RepID=A0A0R3UE46_MESCO|nr:unnamed protein product [Mesocestoides corti]